MTTLAEAYRGRRVLITGNTGFKGSWLSLWLQALGAEVFGYSLAPPTSPNLFTIANIASFVRQQYGDVRSLSDLVRFVREVQPEFVFHLAAQPLVRESYRTPAATVETNVMGTVNLLEAIRVTQTRASVVVVTSDKCYENNEWLWGYRENEPLGGRDPYSASKGCAELITSSWRHSFFADPASGVRLASARAGNVIGGGDWSADRIVVDCINSLVSQTPIAVRNPRATRPWQHVLEPLAGYLLLGSRLSHSSDPKYASSWNFGPVVQSVRPVQDLVTSLIACWGGGQWEDHSDPAAPHEAQLLALNWEKAFHLLGWEPIWDFQTTISVTVEWYKSWHQGERALDQLCRTQIQEYTLAAQRKGVTWAQGAL